MASPPRTTITFWRAVHFCILAVTSPARLTHELAPAKADNKEPDDNPPLPKLELLFHAFWRSLGLVLLSALGGWLTSVVLGHQFGLASQAVIVSLQGTGAMFLLWGTLFVRGWEIQTFGGVTVPERINRWLYRALYCIGTAAVVCSLGLPSSALGETSPTPVGVTASPVTPAAHGLTSPAPASRYPEGMDRHLAEVAKVALPLLGVALGWGLARWGSRSDRRKELRSIMEALLWELRDALRILEAPVLPVPLPSVETLLSRGLLMSLPGDLRATVLEARSSVATHDRLLAAYLRIPGADAIAFRETRDHLYEVGQAARPHVEKSIGLIEVWMVNTDFGLARRSLWRIFGKPAAPESRRTQ